MGTDDSIKRWGVTGWSNVWTALGSDVPHDDEDAASALDGYGVQRTVDPGVVYRPPPDVPGVPRWHPKPGSGGRILQMPWPATKPPDNMSLLDLQAILAGKRGRLAADDPDLAALDAGIDQLLAAAAALHAAGRSVGFLQPDSVRVGRADGETFIVLPDVGFAWDNQSGLMMPRWISDPQLPQLFDRGAVQRNEACLVELRRSQNDDRTIHQRAADGGAAELADVKILARLVATALAGEEAVRSWCRQDAGLLKLPLKKMAPETQADIWDKVIDEALKGQVRTCEELRMRLATYRPSSHFLHVPPTAPWVSGAWLRRAALVGMATAAAGLLWLASPTVIKWFVGEPAPFCRVVSKDNPLYAALVELKKAREAARGDVGRRPEYWQQLAACRGDHADPATCGGRCLDELAEEWLAQAEEEGRAVRERLRSRPRPTPDEVGDVNAAIAAIRQAEAEVKHAAAPSVVRVLERELKLRGGTPSTPASNKPANKP